MSANDIPDQAIADGLQEPVVMSIMLAQTVIQNAITGNVSFIEIFSQINLLQVPSAITFHVVTFYAAGNTRAFNHVVRVTSPSISWEAHVPIAQQEAPPYYVGAGPVTLLLSGEDDLTVAILIDGREAHSRTYPVRKAIIATAGADPSVGESP